MSGEMQWTIEGAEGQPIIGDAHVPEEARGAVLIVHGFLGYKDYGMFPHVARSFAREGFVAHRFNLSHSGMTNDIDTFERADLFERDTWNKQVTDVSRVMEHVDGGALPGQGLPIILLGHSRGGVSVLLTAGRRFRDGSTPLPTGVISLAAPDACDRASTETIESLESRGSAEVVSNRTGQTLRIDRAWLDEQRAAPKDHDVLALCAGIACPVLVGHGKDDPTVPSSCAERIAEACPDARLLLIDGANHVLNAPNPMSVSTNAPEALSRFLDASIRFAKECAGARR